MACESKCANNCFEDWISCGPYNSVITFYTGLDAGDYTANLTDKFDHKYQLPVTVDDSGVFEINLNDLPEGLFNEFGGAINLSLSKDGCDDFKITVKEGYDFVEYDCIDISVKGGTMEKTTIGCVIGPTLEPTRIDFTNSASIGLVGPTLTQYGNGVDIKTYFLVSPGVYELANVTLSKTYLDGQLQQVTVINGSTQTGYIILS